MLDATCEAMARGGLYDQLGGGFARYSVDRGWVVPHFEKMLYDNAQLLGLYARWGGPTGGAGRRARPPTSCSASCAPTEGGFASALDADSEGVEGKFYAWTPAELADVLGAEDGAWAARLLEVTERGHLRARRLDAAAARATPTTPSGTPTSGPGCSPPARRGSARPATTRSSPPGTGWRSAALVRRRAAARARRVRRAPRSRPASCWLGCTHAADGRLLRVSRDGVAGRHAGVLEDHGCVASGYLVAAAGHRRRGLARRRAEAPARGRARRTSAPTTAASTTPPTTPRRWSPGRGTRPTTPARPGSSVDGARARDVRRASPAPAGTAQAAEAALRHGPGAGRAGAAVRRLVAGGRRGDARRPGRGGRGRAGRARTATPSSAAAPRAPGSGRAWSPTTGATTYPLLVGRAPVDGRAAAYVCRNLVCERPVTDPAPDRLTRPAQRREYVASETPT